MSKLLIAAIFLPALACADIFPLDLHTTTDVHKALTHLLGMAQARRDALEQSTSPAPRLVEYRVLGLASNYTTTNLPRVQAGVTSWWTNVYYTFEDHWTGFTNRSLGIDTAGTNRFAWIAGSGASVLWGALDVLDAYIETAGSWNYLSTDSNWTDPRVINAGTASTIFSNAWATNWTWVSRDTQWISVSKSYPGYLPTISERFIMLDYDFEELVRYPTPLAHVATNYWRCLSWTSAVDIVTSVDGWKVGNLYTNTTTNVPPELRYEYTVQVQSFPMVRHPTRYATNNSITLGYFTAALFPHTNTATAQYPLRVSLTIGSDTSVHEFALSGYHVEEIDFRPVWWIRWSYPEYSSATIADKLRITRGLPFADSLSWTSSPPTSNSLNIVVDEADSNWLSEVTWLYQPGSALTYQDHLPSSWFSVASETPRAWVHPDDLGAVQVVSSRGSTSWPTVAALSVLTGTNRGLIAWVMDPPSVVDYTNIIPFRVRITNEFAIGNSIAAISNRLCGVAYNDLWSPQPEWFYSGWGSWLARAGRWEGGAIGIFTGRTPAHVGDEVRLVHAAKAQWGSAVGNASPEGLNARWEALAAMRVYSSPPDASAYWRSSVTSESTTCVGEFPTNGASEYLLAFADLSYAPSAYPEYASQAMWWKKSVLGWELGLTDDEETAFAVTLEGGAVAVSALRTFEILPRWALPWATSNVVAAATGSVFAYYGPSWQGTSCPPVSWPWPTSVCFVATGIGVSAPGTGGVAALERDDSFGKPSISPSEMQCLVDHPSWYGDIGSELVQGGPSIVTGRCGTYTVPAGTNAMILEAVWGYEGSQGNPSYIGVFEFDFVADGTPP